MEDTHHSANISSLLSIIIKETFQKYMVMTGDSRSHHRLAVLGVELRLQFSGGVVCLRTERTRICRNLVFLSPNVKVKQIRSLLSHSVTFLCIAGLFFHSCNYHFIRKWIKQEDTFIRRKRKNLLMQTFLCHHLKGTSFWNIFHSNFDVNNIGKIIVLNKHVFSAFFFTKKYTI